MISFLSLFDTQN